MAEMASKTTLVQTPNNSTNKILVALLVIVCIIAVVLLVVMCVYIGKYNQLAEKQEPEAKVVQEELKNHKSMKLYADFTGEQIEGILEYLRSESGLGVVKADNASFNNNYVYSIAQCLPPKDAVLNFLYNGGPEPAVKAKVTLFMGGTTPKSVKEVLVHPIDTPTTMEGFINPGNSTPTWQSRPWDYNVEEAVIDELLSETMEPLIPMLKAQHGMWYGSTCSTDEEECLYKSIVPRVVPGETDRTIYCFFNLGPKGIQGYYLYPIPLLIAFTSPGNGDIYELRALYYDEIRYASIDDLIVAYNNGDVRKLKPDAYKDSLDRYGSLKRRGKDNNPNSLPPPSQSTTTRRFTVNDHHISWLGFEMDFQFSSLTAYQLYNIKFNGESLVYHLGLQDVFVYYTGNTADQTYKSYVDSGWALGVETTSLIRGHDCPSDAVYVDASVYDNSYDELWVKNDYLCVFEYRNHVPLRRHASTYRDEPFTMNMPDVVLVVRGIITVWNYDYIVDVEFHQTGVIKTQVHSTGYIQITRSNLPDTDIRYGYDLLPELQYTGLFHNHFFVFKADLDIGDPKSNSFETLEMKSATRNNPFNSSVVQNYMYVEQSLKSTELEAIIKYDFSKPKQYVIFNQNDKNEYNNQSRGYRIQSSSWANTVIPEDDILFNTPSWVNEQISVTKQKDSENTMVNYFSQGDPFNPLISLAQFQTDDENIVNEDLVSWISLGVNHIPTAEDIPVTTTASKELSFYLVPHNYFNEDPSIASKDAYLHYP